MFPTPADPATTLDAPRPLSAPPARAAVRRARRRRPWTQRARRWMYYRFVVPLKRSQHAPEHAARGSLVGLAWAFTPTVGLQIGFVLLTWFIARRLLRWDFNLIVGMAWSWVVNAVTMLPIYYLFYVTGQLLLGRWDDLAGYGSFLSLWESAFGIAPAPDDLGAMTAYYGDVLLGWGIAIVVGCVPWAVGVGWLGYFWTLRYVRRHRAAREARRRARRLELAAERAAAAADPVDFARPAV